MLCASRKFPAASAGAVRGARRCARLSCRQRCAASYLCMHSMERSSDSYAGLTLWPLWLAARVARAEDAAMRLGQHCTLRQSCTVNAAACWNTPA